MKKITKTKVFVCKICGEAYIGEKAPSRCPFCGAFKKFFVKTKDYDTGAWDAMKRWFA